MEQSAVEIAFDCLPLSRVGRIDVPLDASDGYRLRVERLKRAIESHPVERTYFLYNSRCVFRLANSEVDGLLRFEFEGAVQTDASDGKTAAVDVDCQLASNTCGELPPEVLAWLVQRLEAAIAIEFDRYIAAGRANAADIDDAPLPLSALLGMGV